VRHFDPRELRDYLTQAETPPLLLDVREPWEYAVAHIEGSQLVPMRDLPHTLHDLDRDREVVVICHHGVRSFQAAYFLERSGFAKVVNLTGGIHAWARQVDSSMQQY
jgi:rhodanese-related sulfurtransferase